MARVACRALTTALLTLAAAVASSQDAAPKPANVVLAGRMGDRALVMVGGQPHMLAVGQTAGGVRLLRWQDDAAVVEHGGRTSTLQVGGSPSNLGGAAPNASGREIVISAGPGGHFVTGGAINGRAVQFMVDTGATLLAMSMADAQRLGIDLKNARRSMTRTANGDVPTQLVTLSSVRVGDVQLANIEAVVVPAAMPYVLLGNSFLTRFQMRRENDVMRLELR